MSYQDTNNDGVIASTEILEENNYYPFGLKHKGYNSNNAQPGYKYKYQGQERQDELGLNWDGFKWRNYDPAIGRFMSVDPLAEKYHWMTDYQFSSNQVVHTPELEGMVSTHDLSLDNTFTFGFMAASFDGEFAPANGMLDEVVVQGKGSGSTSYQSYGVQANEDYGVGQPGTWESIVPVWGAGRAAVDHFQNGNYWRGTAYAAIAITDVFLIKAAVTAVAKIGATAVVEVSAKEVAEEVVAKEGIFFEGTSYSPKVLKQMSVTGDMFHAFPKSVDGFATKFGQFSTKLGIDGKSYQSLEMSGSYGGKTGRLNTLKIQTGLLIIDFSMSLKYRSMKIISNYLNFIKEKGKPLSEINPGSDEIALTVTMLHEHWNY